VLVAPFVVDPMPSVTLSRSLTDVIVTVMPELLTLIWKSDESNVVKVNELVVLVETGFSTPPIEKLIREPAAKLLVWNPLLTVIFPLDTMQLIAVWNPAIDAQDAAEVAASLILI
jgi:hypothetical protein